MKKYIKQKRVLENLLKINSLFGNSKKYFICLLYMFCNRYKQDICNYYMYLCGNNEVVKTYEEQLLDKYFDKNYETLTDIPPFVYTNFIQFLKK